MLGHSFAVLSGLLVSLLGWAVNAANVVDPVHCGFFANALQPAPQTDPAAIERFQEINREAGARSHTVVFLGDSLTRKWDPSVWDQHFARLDALNAGVNGDRTEHLLWRVEHGNVQGQNPELVVLLIGTNDIGRNRPSQVIAEGVREILIALRAQLPATRILLLGVLPRSESSSSERRQQVKTLNQLIQNCADHQHVFYADIGGALLDNVARLARDISPDGVHLSEHGYRLLTARLEQELARLHATK
jgi:lysophospholipase L1-like esterase